MNECRAVRGRMPRFSKSVSEYCSSVTESRPPPVRRRYSRVLCQQRPSGAPLGALSTAGTTSRTSISARAALIANARRRADRKPPHDRLESLQVPGGTDRRRADEQGGSRRPPETTTGTPERPDVVTTARVVPGSADGSVRITVFSAERLVYWPVLPSDGISNPNTAPAGIPQR